VSSGCLLWEKERAVRWDVGYVEEAITVNKTIVVL